VVVERQIIRPVRCFSIAAAGSTLAVAGCHHESIEEPPVDQSVRNDFTQAPVDMSGDADIPLSPRRPFLVGSSLRAALPVAREDWLDPVAPANLIDPTTSRALAAAWLKDALEEHASVAAFARFSIMGLAVGAPSDIVADAQRASLDEIRHARICFGLARRYGSAEAGPGPLRVDDALGALDLVALARLTAEEGCVGETLGALLAERQAAMASDLVVKAALTKIARDEQRHAELAWRFVAWASQVGGALVVEEVARAVSSAIVATRATALRALTVDVTTWHAHGRLTCAESKAIAEEGIEKIVLPALAHLQGRVPQATSSLARPPRLGPRKTDARDGLW
jgi:hypothetical protein